MNLVVECSTQSAPNASSRCSHAIDSSHTVTHEPLARGALTTEIGAMAPRFPAVGLQLRLQGR